MCVENLRRVAERIDSIDWQEGLTAYSRYRQTMHRMADYYEYPLKNTVAAFCALSPNSDYWGNLRSLVTLMRGGKRGNTIERLTVSSYGHCKRRAWAFLHGEDFLARTQGLKTRAFYMNIMNPLDPVPVTVDGHMFNCWRGERITLKKAVSLGIEYEEVAGGIRELASTLDVLPCQLQAMLWFTWKRINNIVYDPQLTIRVGDQWRLDVYPEEVRPFE